MHISFEIFIHKIVLTSLYNIQKFIYILRYTQKVLKSCTNDRGILFSTKKNCSPVALLVQNVTFIWTDVNMS